MQSSAIICNVSVFTDHYIPSKAFIGQNLILPKQGF